MRSDFSGLKWLIMVGIFSFLFIVTNSLVEEMSCRDSADDLGCLVTVNVCDLGCGA